MASIDVLYSCSSCHNKFKYDELSHGQQLCKSCRRKFPLVQCSYCRLDFHQLDSTSNDLVCDQCEKELELHGTPSNCSICNLPSAFKGTICIRCLHAQRKYGNPVNCEHCKLKCAFHKSTEAKKKVNGKTLCLLCTLNYKKTLFKRTNDSRHKDKHVSVSKKAKLDVTSFSSATSSSSASSVPLYNPVSSVTRMETMDPLASGLVQQNEKLQNEITSMKKQISLKDQQLLEKDKMICSLKADNLEREKDHRVKIQSLQKQHSDSVSVLKVEIQSLKKQLSHQTTTKQKIKVPTHISSSLLS